MIKTLFKHGDSLALIVEPAWLDLLEAKAGDAFEVKIDGHSLVMTPVKKLKEQEDFKSLLCQASSCYAKLLDKLSD